MSIYPRIMIRKYVLLLIFYLRFERFDSILLPMVITSGTAIITIDIGTTSMRAILFDAKAEKLASSQVENAPTHYPDGRVEQDARSWAAILLTVLSDTARAAESKGLKVQAIAVTAQRSSVIPLDREGEPLYKAIMWQDTRTAGLCTDMASDSPGVYRKTGLKISPVFSAIKMRWFRENEPELHARTWKMAGIQDYILYLLTGKAVTDRCLASRTNLFNLHTLEWDAELLSLFGVEESRLCELIDQGSVAGTLLSTVASRSGLSSGIPVISAGGDQQCAALGLGLTGPGRIVANTGTGSYIIGHSGHPALDPQMRVFCNVSAIPGAYILEAGMLTSGTIYRWFSENFYGGPDAAGKGDGRSRSQDVHPRDKGGAESPPRPGVFELLNQEAAASPPGSNGVTLLPHFRGAGAPYWDPSSQGVFFGLGLGTGRGDMARAVLEGIAAEMSENIRLVTSLSGMIDSVRVSGGLARSELFNRIQASTYGLPVIRPGESESTALGAWIQAAVAIQLYPGRETALETAESTGIKDHAARFEPEPELIELYARRTGFQKKLYESLSKEGLFSAQ